jgi:hypothetical protein
VPSHRPQLIWVGLASVVMSHSLGGTS